jgi:hypothetical protein
VSVQLCLSCGAPVYTVKDSAGQPRTLDTEHHHLGAYTLDHDGEHCHFRNAGEIQRGVAGYRVHECQPVEQAALFEAGEVG